MIIEDLYALAPTPESPVEAGSTDLWKEVESRLGTPLPDDYKQFVNRYGAGDFCDVLCILTPFAPPTDKWGFFEAITPLLDDYHLSKSNSDLVDQCPFPAFPEQNGLLPFGGDTNGGTWFWLTQGSPGDWSIVIYDWRGGSVYEKHDMPIVRYLIECRGEKGDTLLCW
jgi:hypothetical protein